MILLEFRSFIVDGCHLPSGDFTLCYSIKIISTVSDHYIIPYKKIVLCLSTLLYLFLIPTKEKKNQNYTKLKKKIRTLVRYLIDIINSHLMITVIMKSLIKFKYHITCLGNYKRICCGHGVGQITSERYERVT